MQKSLEEFSEFSKYEPYSLTSVIVFSIDLPVQRLAVFLSGQCSSLAAFRMSSAVQLSSCFSYEQCSFFSAFLGAHRPSGSRWVCVTSSRELRSTCFIGFLSVQCFWNARMTSEIVTLGQAGSTVILAAQLSLWEFCATRRIRFDVSDLFQNRPSWKGAAVAGPFC